MFQLVGRTLGLDQSDDKSAAGAPVHSGVGVLDKSMAVLDAVATAGQASLSDLVSVTGLPRATVHRLAVAWEHHGMLRRSVDGRFQLGLHLVGLGHAAAAAWPLAEAARPALHHLRDVTGESVQIYVRDMDHRVCLVSLESPHELRTIVAEGARLPLQAGSAGRVLRGEIGTRGWVASLAERAAGVGSVSAPVYGPDGRLVAAVGVSGPLDRLGRQPGARLGEAVKRAARSIEVALEHLPAQG